MLTLVIVLLNYLFLQVISSRDVSAVNVLYCSVQKIQFSLQKMLMKEQVFVFIVPKNAVLNIYQNPTRAATTGASVLMRTGAARWHHEPAAGPASTHQPHDWAGRHSSGQIAPGAPSVCILSYLHPPVWPQQGSQPVGTDPSHLRSFPQGPY